MTDGVNPAVLCCYSRVFALDDCVTRWSMGLLATLTYGFICEEHGNLPRSLSRQCVPL